MFVTEKAKGEVKELDAVSDLLLAAAAVVEQRGLAQFTQEADDGRVCAAGAISIAATGHAYQWSALIDRASRKLAADPELRQCGCISGPAMWNNADERTAAEVIAKLRAVAFSC